ncbi:hypothetical protein O7623_04530 [Solwaraspora sp. WMMD791]|uniref:hypothetical protein n=1 Tax=Solwaraspora sp. WMMD791 TaxID=3016086 RepID=UPI002499DA5D|nr:hypothetical protein [Solwaraspora sp. WMMD791]WFE28484.1 hypothetical protein O7623_04530 [Solwaraspora sp. WMMD791]
MQTQTLTAAGRLVRVLATVAAFTLLLAGTLWGTDDHFPFGPFSMYAGINGPNDPAPDTRVEGVDATGRTLVLTERNAGVRRAEVEGLESAYVDDPGRLELIADSYARMNPDAPPLVRVSVVVRLHEIRNSALTGDWHDETRAVWERP